MKKLVLIAVISFCFTSLSAKTLITATKNDGQWSSASSWSLNRVPASNDSIVIPSNIKIIVSSNISFLTNVSIVVNGTLQFTNIGILSLDTNSILALGSSGKVTGSPFSGEFIFIGFTAIFSGNTLSGSSVYSSSGLITPLPVKFTAFTATLENNSVSIRWSTAQEINASAYLVERSFDGSNWNTIADVPAAGNSNEINNYSFEDNNVSGSIIYYRVKQVDNTGAATYTSVKSVNKQAIAASIIKIGSSSAQQVFIQFPAQVTGTVNVRIVSLSGQVISTQTLAQPAGQVVVNTSSISRGIYIVSVSNGKDVNTAKQVVL